MLSVNTGAQEKHDRLHPEISARNSTAAPANHGVEFEITMEKVQTQYPSSGDQSPIRGRTLERTPASNRQISRIASRRDFNRRSTVLDVDAIRERLLSRDLTTEPEEYYDTSPLEPLPFEGFRSYSLSEELHRAATFDSSIDLTKFGGHRDTFAVLGFRRLHNRAVDLPSDFYDNLVRHIDFDTYKAIRLSCRNWSQAVSRARPIVLPPVTKVPTEILEKIYAYLEPGDFNAARHTCRVWMIASLEEKLLVSNLRRSGWWSAAKLDVANYEQIEGVRRASVISEDWILSKRLATELALGPMWRGNGLTKKDLQDILAGVRRTESCVTLTGACDFSELGNAAENGAEGSNRHFQVSACQRYLLVYQGSAIYIYSICGPDDSPSHGYGGYLQLVTTVLCPNRVLAISMDTSSKRYAIAALLEDRVGLVCNLESDLLFPPNITPTPHLSPLTRSSKSRTFASFKDLDSDRMSWTMDDTPNRHMSFPYPSSPHCFIPISRGHRTIYHNICSPEDLPCSVAICPQRRCVAFGNSAGIELHWTDALSGQDLQRWFPLFTPSDHLFFLPNRPGVDSNRKLRLLSSAAYPSYIDEALEAGSPRSSRNVYLPSLRSQTWAPSIEHPIAYSLNGPNLARNRPDPHHLGTVQHYQAIPLSDGYNIVFTDPISGNVCLGGDAAQSQGTTQLTRRFVFERPGEVPEGVAPHRYSAGQELRWGARVVVAYGDRVWLYTVPGDVFFGLHAFARQPEDERSHEDDGENNDAAPVSIRGAYIASVPGLVHLSVDTTAGDLTIWTISAEGKVCTWQCAGSGRRDLVERIVCDDGNVAVLMADDGADVEMRSTGSWEMDGEYDGARSCLDLATAGSPAADADADGRHHHAQSGGRLRDRDCDGNLDGDGDVIMTDTHTQTSTETGEVEDEGYFSDDEGHDAEFAATGGRFAIRAPPVDGRWSQSDGDWVPEYLAAHGTEVENEGLGVDVLGLIRVEVEVLGCGG